MYFRCLCVAFMVSFAPMHAFARQSVKESVSKDALVPKHLIPLLHASEVQTELQLTAEQLEALEAHFANHDGEWFRSRKLPLEKQSSIMDQLGIATKEWLKKNFNTEQQNRLRQIELQAQGVRILLRPDIERELKLNPKQMERLSEQATATFMAFQYVAKANSKGKQDPMAQTQAQEAQEREEQVVKEILSPTQHQKLLQLLGKPFETSQLKRILPMAPKLVTAERWINSRPIQIEELRGKVVLVHFYAFQCHNCHANFEIYKRWHEKLSNQGVVVIGIQTPETPDERKPDSVIAAAKEKGLLFPILIDLESKNWAEWGNTMWPTVYVVDKRGYLRYWWEGELNWQGATGDKTIEQMVDQLLKEE